MVFIEKTKCKNHTRLIKVTLFLIISFFYFHVLAIEVDLRNRCGDVFKNKPWDYSDPENHINNVGMVERYHFTESVRTLKSGSSSDNVMDDLAYTLNRFPNHYPAILASIEYDRRLNGRLPQVKNRDYEISIECIFYRALTFKPSDLNIHHLYGIYFYKKKKFKKALQEFERAEPLNSPEVFYNIGLAYFELGDYGKSRYYAEKAKELGYPQEGLLRKLKGKNDTE